MEKFSRILDTKNHGQVVVILFTDKDKESAVLEITYKKNGDMCRYDVSLDKKNKDICIMDLISEDNVFMSELGVFVKRALSLESGSIH